MKELGYDDTKIMELLNLTDTSEYEELKQEASKL